jgi:hypothetical protein
MTDLLERHARLSKYLGIDIDDIEEAFKTTFPISQEAGELAARADHLKLIAKYNLELAEANAAQRIRSVPVNGKPPGQTTIDSMVPMDQEVQDAQQVYADAAYEAKVCEVLYENLRSQGMSLNKLADLHTTGYFNPSALTEQRRAEIRRAFLEADQRRKPIPRPTG